MKVVVDQTVHIKMNEFYEIALQLHPTLDGKTIAKKMNRIFSELDRLGHYATIYNKACLRSSWIQNGYGETGEPYVYVHDACHSYLYKE